MPKSNRIWVFIALLVMVGVFGTDWLISKNRLSHIRVQYELSNPSVMADGKSTLDFQVTFTEDGKPRVGDLCQLWIDVGGGVVQPEWVYTDENGQVQITYRPNSLSRYEVQDKAVIHIRDIGVGRLIEVGKDVVLTIPLETPEEEDQQSIFN